MKDSIREDDVRRRLRAQIESLEEQRDALRQANSKLLQDLQEAGVKGRKVADREWQRRLENMRIGYEGRIDELTQQLEIARSTPERRKKDLEDVIKRLEMDPEPKNEPSAVVTAVTGIATAVASGIRKLREELEEGGDSAGYIAFLENKIKERDRRIENMVGELQALYESKFDSLDDTSPAKQVNELAEVLMHEFGNFFDRSEGAVDMAIRLLRGFKNQ